MMECNFRYQMLHKVKSLRNSYPKAKSAKFSVVHVALARGRAFPEYDDYICLAN